MRCPECGNENPEGAKFCMKCGTRFSQLCPQCGAGNLAEAVYCEQCGASLLSGEAGRPRRRWMPYVAAFIGVVGFVAVIVVVVWFVLPILEPVGATPTAVSFTLEPTVSLAPTETYTPLPDEPTPPAGKLTVTLPPLPTQAETPVPSKPTSQADAPSGLILDVVLAADGGSFEPRLVVRNIEGKEVGQIPLSDSPSYYISYSLKSNLVRTADNKWSLLDASEFTAQQLAIPTEEAANLIPGFRFLSRWPERHTVLYNGSGESAYLVNLETGEVFDLLAVDPEVKRVPALQFSADTGRFSANDEYLAFLTDAGVWLLATDHPEQARQLGDKDGLSGGFSFSGDGQQIAYSQRRSNGVWEVVVENVDGTNSKVVATGDWFDSVAFVPGQKKLVLVREKALTLLSLDNGEEQELLHLRQRYFTWFAPSGHRLLAGAPDERGWHIVDLEQCTSRTLDELSGFDLLFRKPFARWLLFRDISGTYATGARVAALDLETGAVVLIRGLDSGIAFGSITTTSADAGRVLMEGRLGDGERGLAYWLVMAEQGEARPLADGHLSRPSLSADGRWFLYNQWHEDRQKGEIILLEVDSGKTRSLGEGIGPVWVRP